MEIVKESVFISAIRSFCKTLFGTVGIFIAIIPLFIIIALGAGSKEPFEKTVFTPLPDLSGSAIIQPCQTPAILQISIQGIIGGDSLTSQMIYNQLLDSRKGLLQKDRVKGILLYLKTPGGTVIDSDNIYRALMQYKAKYNVPVYAYVDGLCASGGVYVSCAADKIYSSPIGIIGSVGVIAGQYFNVYDTLTKYGVKMLSVQDGKNKNSLSPFRQWEPDEDTNIKNICSALYQNFVNIVSTARPLLTKEKLINEYGASIYDAQKAQEYGYIDDCNSSYSDTLTALLQKAGIDIEKPYQVVELQPRGKWLASLLKGESSLGKIVNKVFQDEPKEDVWRHFSYLYQP